jgi:hypothetical protein
MYACSAEAVEEVGFVDGGVGGGADELAQLLARNLVAVLPPGLAQLGWSGCPG